MIDVTIPNQNSCAMAVVIQPTSSTRIQIFIRPSFSASAHFAILPLSSISRARPQKPRPFYLDKSSGKAQTHHPRRPPHHTIEIEAQPLIPFP